MLKDNHIDKLSELEIELLLGNSSGWGSWMFECGEGLIAKGLGRKDKGSIYFDTPAAKIVIGLLSRPSLEEWQPIESAPKGDDPKEENGPPIIGWREGWTTGYEVYWFASEQAWYFANLDSEYGSPEYPTHWQPLPKALEK